jgi:hypothetical protein
MILLIAFFSAEVKRGRENGPVRMWIGSTWIFLGQHHLSEWGSFWNLPFSLV